MATGDSIFLPDLFVYFLCLENESLMNVNQVSNYNIFIFNVYVLDERQTFWDQSQRAGIISSKAYIIVLLYNIFKI